jgi:hypothetical protein
MRTPTGCRRLLLAALPAAWLILSAAVRPVWADEVSGRVTVEGKPARNATLILHSERKKEGPFEVRTSDEGIYRVFLEPGRYQVSLRDRPGEVLVLESLPAPVTRDLAFGRR